MQFRSVPLDLVKIDLRSFEDGKSLPGPTGDGRTSCKLCLQDPIEDPISRRRQLLQTAVERRRSCIALAPPDSAESLHAEAEAVIAFHSEFCGVIDKFVGERFSLEIVRTCQVRVETCPGQRHAEPYRMIEFPCLG